jgi:hypothetical protein
LPFAYSPYRLDIDAAQHLTAANEGIDFIKFSVKKNRYSGSIFFACDDIWMRSQRTCKREEMRTRRLPPRIRKHMYVIEAHPAQASPSSQSP